MFILARIFFFLVVCIAVGITGYLLWTRLLRPLVFKEDMSEKIVDAGEDYVESEVDKAADKIRKGKL